MKQTGKNELSLKDSRLKRLNEKVVLKYINVEKSKPSSDGAISTEYTQKVILYGYLMVRIANNLNKNPKNNIFVKQLFASSFTLGPLILLLINVLDLRVDGLRLIWLFRRPVAQRAQDIGAWTVIIRFLNVVGIVTNAFIIAFTSNWSITVLQNKLEYRLLFVILFEVLLTVKPEFRVYINNQNET